MKTLALSLTLLGAVCVPLWQATPAQAQSTRTWVSGTGDDANPCSRLKPCLTFAGAMAATLINGEINCVDAGGYGPVTITKSLTIDCHENFASILTGPGTGIVINLTTGEDQLQTVRLRNLNINGSGKSGPLGVRGINILKAKAVFIEDVLVDGVGEHGINDDRAEGGKLEISNTTVRNAGKAGIGVGSASGARIDATLTNVSSLHNTHGVVSSNGSRVAVRRSTMFGNAGSGVFAEGQITAGEISVSESVVSGNALGFQQLTGGTIRLSGSEVAYNTTLGSGTANSFSTNRIFSNGPGGTVTAIGGANTNPSGHQ